MSLSYLQTHLQMITFRLPYSSQIASSLSKLKSLFPTTVFVLTCPRSNKALFSIVYVRWHHAVPGPYIF